ncbi:uncharacterized protein LOC125433032 isoform X2 [Sphaerodactylus townsendi]|uniref:uncharacterized protein LOC125433032 isoform X2 n=1 Tax=Sphaerodactylus townsendi TaxID=933632 RepID=UPI002026DC84|nr:uncharacterized protein LOC125433032 isoform X2 [Sphaerodactylus townsendi]
MKQLYTFLLVLRGLFVLSKTHSSTTPLLPSIERPVAEGRKQEMNMQQGESLRLFLFCGQENWNTEKVWCKEQPNVCIPRRNPVIFSEPEWKILTMASNEKVKLGESRKGCVSVHILTVEEKDSGQYWFGQLNGKNIDYLVPIKIVVHKDFSATTVPSPTFRTPFFESPEWRPIQVVVVQGKPVNLVGFCGQQYWKAQKVWCKGELLEECDLKAPGQLLGQGWKYLTTEPNQRIIIRNSSNDCVSFHMSDLQLKDKGIYWFGFLDGWNVRPLTKVTVIVQEEQKIGGNMTAINKNKSSVYHVVLVESCAVAGIIIIMFITTLLVRRFTKNNVKGATRQCCLLSSHLFDFFLGCSTRP